MKKYDVWNIDNLPEDFDGSVAEYLRNYPERFDEVSENFVDYYCFGNDKDFNNEVKPILDKILGNTEDHTKPVPNRNWPDWVDDEDVIYGIFEHLEEIDNSYAYYYLVECIAENEYDECEPDDYEPDVDWDNLCYHYPVR